MNEIIYVVDNIKRRAIMFIKREEIEKRHVERANARRIRQICYYSGLNLELTKKGDKDV